MAPRYLSQGAGAEQPVLVRVRVKPRGGRDQILGERDGLLELRVAAPPAEGAANKAAAKLVAAACGVPPSRAVVVGGLKHREKTIALSDASLDSVAAALAEVVR